MTIHFRSNNCEAGDPVIAEEDVIKYKRVEEDFNSSPSPPPPPQLETETTNEIKNVNEIEIENEIETVNENEAETESLNEKKDELQLEGAFLHKQDGVISPTSGEVSKIAFDKNMFLFYWYERPKFSVEEFSIPKALFQARAPADFFPGGGSKKYFLPKKEQEINIFFKKVQKHAIFGWPMPGKSPPPPLRKLVGSGIYCNL
jgi:hypothetical protein